MPSMLNASPSCVEAERVEMTEGAECTREQSAKLCHALNGRDHLIASAAEVCLRGAEQSVST